MKFCVLIIHTSSISWWRRGLKIAFMLLVAAFLFSSASAQIDRAALDGTVTDPKGRVLPGVAVSAVQEAIGLHRETVTSSQGTYDIPGLPVGSYTVTFTRDGFQSYRFENVLEEVGKTRTLNVRLQLARTSEQVNVSGNTQSLDQTSDSLATQITRKQVTELPLNGRNWASLTALTSGAVDAGGSNQRTIRFAGRGLDDNDFTYDGIDATNIVNQAQPAFVRLAIPTESIQEFRIESALFTAESANTPGGQVAVVSGAGTNVLHGSIFDFLRNDVFDAREPVDTLNPTKPVFHLNQFGGSVGGPVVHDRTFVYISYEGLRQSLGQTLRGFVPTDAVRSQAAAESPALAPILNAFPKGQTNTSSAVAQFVGAGKQLDHENSGMLRFDHRLNERTTAFVRFNMDEAVSSLPLGSSGQYLEDRQNVSSRPVNAAAELLHIFSPSLVAESKFGFNRGTVLTTNSNLSGLPYAISIPGFTTLPNNQTKIAVGNTFSWIENVTEQKGKHLVKFGGEVRRIQLNQGSSASGTISFSSVNNFVNDAVNSAAYAAALPVNGLRKTEFFGFIQNEYRWRPNVTINAGMRYEFYNRFHEVLNRAIPFDLATCGSGGFCGAGAEFSRPNISDVDPRLAVAWAPTALGGKTVFRAGGGIYHGDGQLDDQNLPIANEVERFSLSAATIPQLSYPVDPFLAGATGIVSPREMNRFRKDMYVSQWGASIQQGLPHGFVDTLSYVGSKGTHLLTTAYVNVLDPVTRLRPNPNFGQIEYRGNDNNSSFQGLQTSLQRSFQHGLLLSANYLWSHEIDNDALGGGDADFPQNVSCSRCDRASGDYDARHLFNANAIYELPFGHGRAHLRESGVLQTLFGSWDLTSIVTARSSLPLNVTADRSASTVPDGNTVNQRPNLVPGVALVPITQSTAQWINPAAFAIPQSGTFGTLGRNALRGPRLWQTDLGLAKHVGFTERLRADFRAEVFNIFNRAQYGAPVSDISSANFGRILSTVNTGPVGTGTPRQMQFMLRLEF